MAKLNDAAKAEIAEAVRILREDGIHIHRTYAQFQESLKNPKAADGESEDEPKEGDAPPEKEKQDPPAPRRSAWWG